jgi:purine-nucleoside phosphorylase
VLSSDEFYEDDPKAYKHWAEYGILCVEMEAAGIYTIAAKYKVKALTVLTISDSLITGEQLSAEARESSFREMVQIALAAAMP